VCWRLGGTKRAQLKHGIIFSSMGKETIIISWEQIFVHHRIVSAVKRVDSDRMSCTVVRGRWCNIIVLNVHDPSEGKSGDSKDSFYDELERKFYHFSKYLMKIVLDFIANLERENILKPTIRNESLHQDSNDNVVRIVNFAKSKNLVVNSTMFPQRNIHNYTWTPPDGQTNKQIEHILIGRRRHSSILHVRSFRGTDCGNDHCLGGWKGYGKNGCNERCNTEI
jgi:hypothetical protein